jgi:uncharacterized membrane protein
MPLLDLFWSTLYIFLLIAWFWVVISVVTDVFRSQDLGGFGKAVWVIFVIVIPWLGVLLYLIARGGGMTERTLARAAEREEAARAYVRDAGGASVADEVAKLADLRDRGVVTDEEFAAQKAKLLA